MTFMHLALNLGTIAMIMVMVGTSVWLMRRIWADTIIPDPTHAMRLRAAACGVAVLGIAGATATTIALILRLLTPPFG